MKDREEGRRGGGKVAVKPLRRHTDEGSFYEIYWREGARAELLCTAI